MAEPEDIRLPTIRVVIDTADSSENEDELPGGNSSTPSEPQGEPLSGLSQHLANADSVWKAIASFPDFCRVGSSITAFDSSATLDNPVRYSPNVIAAGREVYRDGDLFQGIQGDTGQHVVSGTSLDSGCVLILEGQHNVKVNGLPVARHDSPCTVNCNAGGEGGTPGYLMTEPQDVASSPGQSGEGGPVYNPGEEGLRVINDKWEGAKSAAKTAWEMLPFTGDEATTGAARDRAWQGAKDTYEAVDVLTGPGLLDLLDSGVGYVTGDAERAGRFGEEWKRTGEAYGGLWDAGVEAWQEAEERNGTFGAMEMSVVVLIGELVGGKGTGVLRGATKVPDLETPPPPPNKGVHVESSSARKRGDDDSENSNNTTTAIDVELDSQGRFRDKNGILRTNAGPNAPDYTRWKENGGSIKYDEATDTIIYGKPGMETSSMGNIDVEVPYRPGPPDGHRYPDFSEYSRESVTIPEMRGLPESKINAPEGGDFSKAWDEVSKQKGDNYINETHGISRRSRGVREGQWPDKPSRGYTWHHHGDESTMQLVDKDIHAVFTHKGGASASR